MIRATACRSTFQQVTSTDILIDIVILTRLPARLATAARRHVSRKTLTPVLYSLLSALPMQGLESATLYVTSRKGGVL